MLQKINPSSVLENRLAEVMGLKQYSIIMDMLRKVDVSKDKEFQRIFDGFYRVRRNEQWRCEYFNLFEELKSKSVSFDDILYELYKRTGRVEASFASKMLSTIDSSKPIWDQYVLTNLGMKVPLGNSEKRLARIVEMYDEVQKWYKVFLSSDESKEFLERFDDIFPSYVQISDVKKIDFYLWSMRN